MILPVGSATLQRHCRPGLCGHLALQLSGHGPGPPPVNHGSPAFSLLFLSTPDMLSLLGENENPQHGVWGHP